MGNQKKIVVAMNATLSGQITRAVSNTNKAENAKGAAIQGFVDAKWLGGHFYAPGNPESLATPETYAFLTDAVINGFTATEQALIKADKETAKGWSEAKKANRRKAQMKVGARIADFRKGVEAALKAKGSGRAPGRKRAIDQRVIEDVASIIEYLRKFDPSDRDATKGINIPGIIKELEDAIKLAKG